MSAADPMLEAERVLRICSACMYCDGLCPVFPAIDGKHGFSLSDVSYLSNLCHNCQGCWHDCQYAPPHPFAVNLPATFAELRQRSYAEHLWPPTLGRAFRASSLAVPTTVALALLTTFALVLSTGSTEMLFAADAREGAFYRVLPWPAMAGLAGGTFAWAVIAITLATLRYWRTIAPGGRSARSCARCRLHSPTSSRCAISAAAAPAAMTTANAPRTGAGSCTTSPPVALCSAVSPR